MYNLHILPIPQGRSSYHISNYNLVIGFMWVHKWNVNHVNDRNIYFHTKTWNNTTMKLVNNPKAIKFS